MSTQTRETGKNYIGLLSEETEAQSAAEMQRAADRRIRAYIRSLMATAFGRRREAR